MKTGKAFELTAYTNDAWTSVIAEDADVTAVRVCNTSITEPVIVEFRRGTAQIAGPHSIPAADAQRLDLGTMRVTAAAPLQVRCSAAGVHVTADAVVEVA